MGKKKKKKKTQLLKFVIGEKKNGGKNLWRAFLRKRPLPRICLAQGGGEKDVDGTFKIRRGGKGKKKGKGFFAESKGIFTSFFYKYTKKKIELKKGGAK